jgi:uncharacterized protein (UPF0335 family)
MATRELVNELVEKLLYLENEMTTLKEDKKQLLEDYKDKLDVKAFQAAVRIAKIKAKLRDTSETEFDNMLLAIEDKISVDFIP